MVNYIYFQILLGRFLCDITEMSTSALTIPRKWNSFNSSTVDHLNKTKQSNIPSPRTQRPKSLFIKKFEDASDENLISAYSKDNKLWFKPGKEGKSRSELEIAETNVIPKRTAKQSLGYKFVGGAGRLQIQVSLPLV